jgi:serine/threonine protein phosphatase PrpC
LLTVCVVNHSIVAILDRSGTLHVANVGDCGLRILRSGKVVFATSPQQHYFDCPYQFSSSEGGQSASDAAVTFSSKRAHYFFRRDAGYMHTIDWWN